MALWWLSFVDPDRPEGERFLGVALVEVEHAPADDLRSRVAAVIRKAHRTGCNPGGDVASYEIPLDALPNDRRVILARTPRNTLLSRQALEHYGLI